MGNEQQQRFYSGREIMKAYVPNYGKNNVECNGDQAQLRQGKGELVADEIVEDFARRIEKDK